MKVRSGGTYRQPDSETNYGFRPGRSCENTVSMGTEIFDTPDNYYKRFKNGEIEKKDTFSKRELTEIPKFVQKKIKKSENAEK